MKTKKKYTHKIQHHVVVVLVVSSCLHGTHTQTTVTVSSFAVGVASPSPAPSLSSNCSIFLPIFSYFCSEFFFFCSSSWAFLFYFIFSSTIPFRPSAVCEKQYSSNSNARPMHWHFGKVPSDCHNAWDKTVCWMVAVCCFILCAVNC